MSQSETYYKFLVEFNIETITHSHVKLWHIFTFLI